MPPRWKRRPISHSDTTPASRSSIRGSTGPCRRRRSWSTPCRAALPTRTRIRSMRAARPTPTRFVGIKRLGTAQFYLIAIKDKNGQAFDGGTTYRLTVPPNAPVKQYWSATAYDRETHALIRDMPRASRSSQVSDLAEERRRIGRHLFRTAGAAGQGSELGADAAGPPVRGDVPPLRAGEGVLRQAMGVAGHRADVDRRPWRLTEEGASPCRCSICSPGSC